MKNNAITMTVKRMDIVSQLEMRTYIEYLAKNENRELTDEEIKIIEKLNEFINLELENAELEASYDASAASPELPPLVVPTPPVGGSTPDSSDIIIVDDNQRHQNGDEIIVVGEPKPAPTPQPGRPFSH